jgi:hypothetical protein
MHNESKRHATGSYDELCQRLGIPERVTIGDAAIVLGVNSNTVARLGARGLLKLIWVGHRRFVLVSDLRKFLAAQGVPLTT